MMRGRHGGLPAAIDRAILLPKQIITQGQREVAFRQREDAVRAALRATKRQQSEQEPTGDGDVEMV